MDLSSSYYAQTYSTYNALAALVNVLRALDAPISIAKVELYGHEDFPFISMQHLADFLLHWQCNVRVVRINPSLLNDAQLPAIAYMAKRDSGFVMVDNLDGEMVSYLNPEVGWVTEDLVKFSQKWTGILMEVIRRDIFALIPQEPISKQRTTIAVTLTNAEATLESYIRYHLEIGLSTFFFF